MRKMLVPIVVFIVCLGFVSCSRQSSRSEAVLEKKETFDLGNGVKIEMVLIPAGSFSMGSKNVEDRAAPVHKVTISKPFYIGTYEVTQAQWEAVMGSNPGKVKGGANPVETVSWNDCREFIKKLNEKVPGGGFRLPSEAEWEYACRAGSGTRYCFGDLESGLGEYAWYEGNSGGQPHPVGQKKPNAWGLYDMYGNVREWCQDRHYESYTGAPSDGSAWDTWDSPPGAFRVFRGGDWARPADTCRSSYRDAGRSDAGYNADGFRVSRTP